MISKQKFINQSLELNLFFLRIMKEHSIFMEAAFALKDKNLISQADAFKNEFTTLLSHAISLSEVSDGTHTVPPKKTAPH